MKKVSLTILTALLIMSLATLSFGYGWGGNQQGRGRGPGAGPCAMDGKGAIANLNLTADQEAKLQTIREAHLKDMKPLRDKMFSKRGDLKLLWNEKAPDADKIAAVQKEIRSLRDQMQDKRTANHLALLKVLTPEQQAKIKTYGMGGFGPGKDRGHGKFAGRGPRCGDGPGFGPRGNR